MNLSKNILNRMDDKAKGSSHFSWGWIDLINELGDEISEICPNYEISQVKSKFGGLNFYVKDEDDYKKIMKLTDRAREKSLTICEICGESGELRTNGLVATLCDKHRKNRPEIFKDWK